MSIGQHGSLDVQRTDLSKLRLQASVRGLTVTAD